jgi:hypothetical protein
VLGEHHEHRPRAASHTHTHCHTAPHHCAHRPLTRPRATGHGARGNVDIGSRHLIPPPPPATAQAHTPLAALSHHTDAHAHPRTHTAAPTHQNRLPHAGTAHACTRTDTGRIAATYSLRRLGRRAEAHAHTRTHTAATKHQRRLLRQSPSPPLPHAPALGRGAVTWPPPLHRTTAAHTRAPT